MIQKQSKSVCTENNTGMLSDMSFFIENQKTLLEIGILKWNLAKNSENG